MEGSGTLLDSQSNKLNESGPRVAVSHIIKNDTPGFLKPVIVL